jgi:hypothetical protein
MAGDVCCVCGDEDEPATRVCVICHRPVCDWHCVRDAENDAIAWCDDCEARSIAAHYAAESERSAGDGG